MTNLTTLLQRHDVEAADDTQFRRHVVLIRILLGVVMVPTVAYAVVVAGFLDLHVIPGGSVRVDPRHRPVLSGISGQRARGRPSVFVPPLAAIVFVPTYLLPWHVAKFVLASVSMAALIATAMVVTHRIMGRTTKAIVVALAVVAAWALFEPVRPTMGFGQINLILLGLVAVDCLLPRPAWPRGLLIGLASAIKLTPLVFVLFLLVNRQYRATVVAGGSFIGFGLLGFVLAPRDSVQYWFGVLFASDKGVGTAYAFNQSLNAVLHRSCREPHVLHCGSWRCWCPSSSR